MGKTASQIDNGRNAGMDAKKKMVRIVMLDETGNFNLKNRDFCCVGGLILDIHVPERMTAKKRIKKEQEDLKQLFNEIASAYSQSKKESSQEDNWSVKYPESFHMGDIAVFEGKKTRVNKDVPGCKAFAAGFKDAVTDRVRKWLKDKEGCRFFAYILPTGGVDLPSTNSNLVSITSGDNLYERMLAAAVENSFLYDPECAANHVLFRIATRTRVYDQPDENMRKLYKESVNIKYLDKAKTQKKITYYYEITRESYLKSALMYPLMSELGKRKQWEIELGVEKIQYEQNALSVQEFEQHKCDQAFLYLADIACMIIRDEFRENARESLRLFEHAEQLHQEGWDIRFFSDADMKYRQMIEALEFGSLVDLFGLYYDFKIKAGAEADPIQNAYGYYFRTKLPMLRKRLMEKLQVQDDYRRKISYGLPEFYSRNVGFMGYPENAYEKGSYVAEEIKALIETEVMQKEIRSENYRKLYLFRFADIILRGFNHRGSVKGSEPYIAICEQYKDAVGIEEYIAYKQRAVQIFFNAMDYDSVMKVYLKKMLGKYEHGRWTLSDLEKLKEIMNNLGDKDTASGFLLLGKMYSTVAQAYAFQQKASAEKYFRFALDEMKEDSGNADITRSYLMHFYIDQAVKTGKGEQYRRCREKYEKEAKIYFEAETEVFDPKELERQFDMIMKHLKTRSEMRFALYLFVKGFRVFYLNNPDDPKQEEYKKFVSKMSQDIKYYLINAKTNDLIHPWQLIFSNLYQMLGQNDDDRSFYESRILDPDRSAYCEPTIEAMLVWFRLKYIKQVDRCKEELPITDLLSEEQCMKLSQLYGFDNCREMTGADMLDKLEDKLVYMYN